MEDMIPKSEVQWWLAGLKVLILDEQESGVIDMGVIKKRIERILQMVVDY